MARQDVELKVEPLQIHKTLAAIRFKPRLPLDEKFDVVFTGLNHSLTVSMSGYRIIKIIVSYFPVGI